MMQIDVRGDTLCVAQARRSRSCQGPTVCRGRRSRPSMARSLAAAGITASRCGKALCPARTRRLMAQGASGTRAAAPISPEGTDNTPCLMAPLSN